VIFFYHRVSIVLAKHTGSANYEEKIYTTALLEEVLEVKRGGMKLNGQVGMVIRLESLWALL
jgi:hypothetical protein